MSSKFKLGKGKKYDYPKNIKEVDEMTGEQFEKFIFNYYKEYNGYGGFLTEKNDYGLDIVLWEQDTPEDRIGVQCKRYGPQTNLTETDLEKMNKGVTHYNISKYETGKPKLIIITSAESNQISNRGSNYIENEEIEAYFRDHVLDILKDLDEKLGRNKNETNYTNIAFDSTKEQKGSFRKSTKFVDMLKRERKNISKYNKIVPLYMVFNDKTLKQLVDQKPQTLEDLKKIYGFDDKKIAKFGTYLVNRIRVFLEADKIPEIQEEFVAPVKIEEVVVEPKKDIPVVVEKPAKLETPVGTEEFTKFLKDLRKKIARFNKIEPLYNVFTNKTLGDIIVKKPKTLEDLSSIAGLNAKNIDLFGEYLLREIKKFTE